MNIRTKFAVALTLILVVNLAVGLHGLQRSKQTAAHSAQIYEQTFEIVALSLSAQVHFKKQVQEWKNILLRGSDPAQFELYLAGFKTQEQQTQAAIGRLVGLLEQEPDLQGTAERFLGTHTRLGKDYRAALSHFHPDDPQSYRSVDALVQGGDREPTDLLDTIVSGARAYEAAQLGGVAQQTQGVERGVLILVVGTMSGAVFFMMLLVDRTFAHPLVAATAIARRITDGDLRSPIAVAGRDEPAELLRAMKLMQDSLADSQETLHRSEARTRLLLESSGEGVYGVDTDGRCIFCNPAGARMLGYGEPAKLLGKPMHALMHHSRTDGSPFPESLCRASATHRHGRPAHADDEVFWRADGTYFPVEYRSYPIYQDERLVGGVVTFADISERKRAGDDLRAAHDALAEERALLADRVRERTMELDLANAELARTARAKDEFLAAMSHELRTPLTTVLGIAETLEDGLLGPLNEQQVRAAKTIQESGHHLLSLINDILDVAKVDSGKMQLMWDRVPMQQLCDASLRLVRQAAQHKAIDLSCQVDPQVRLVQGDSRRLKQLLVNLLSNAVKFTPEGGSVGLSVAGDAERHRLRFTVWDTGIGIPREQFGQMFRPFVQLDSKLSRQYGGTGLGLVLAYRMAELHGGSMSLESEVGRGSRFYVDLPWDPEMGELAAEAVPARPAEGRPPPTEAAGRHARVLLAEDNALNAEMLAAYLREMGYEVEVARDGVKAVASATQQPPDLILMDVQMPEMDGLEATRRLRLSPATRETPIIALTALAMPGDRERCLDAGMDDYLAKPLGLKELLQTLQHWLARA
jgi:PAS domain S-box-containing protein